MSLKRSTSKVRTSKKNSIFLEERPTSLKWFLSLTTSSRLLMLLVLLTRVSTSELGPNYEKSTSELGHSNRICQMARVCGCSQSMAYCLQFSGLGASNETPASPRRFIQAEPHCNLVSTEMCSEIPDEQLKRTK
jgi:hypothetical protein